MDCNMPIMDGYEATSQICSYLHSKSLKQPIISAVTGHSEPQYIQRAIRCGMNQVLSKPVDCKLIKFLVSTLGYNSTADKEVAIDDKEIKILYNYVDQYKTSQDMYANRMLSGYLKLDI